MKALDFTRIITALSTPVGWLDLALTLAGIAVAYLLARRWYRKRLEKNAGKKQAGEEEGLSGGVLRVLFPLLAVLLILLERSIFQIYEKPFFLDIALPLVLALAAIRVLVYALHSAFKNAAWLRTSELAISFGVWFLVALYFLGVLPELVEELDKIVLPLGKGLSLWALIKGVVVLIFTLSITLWVSSIIERRLLPREIKKGASYNGRLLLARLFRAILIVVAVLVVLQSIGIDLTVFAVFGGALGVGIGLGLQKLAANYIAGFVVLFERSIKIGDMITVDGRFGVVCQVSTRFVVVRSLDGIDAMIPNEMLLTQTVLNHSSPQREARAALSIQVAYGTDLRLALRLMEQAAMAEPRVADGKLAPLAVVSDFGDSGINLGLGFWVRDPENGQAALKSDVNLRIWDLFGQHGITIPFPQQELRVLNPQELHSQQQR